MKNAIKQELLRIAAEHRGILRPEDVVEAAKPKASPLHDRFQWNDGKAAYEYRLWQARQLISVTVTYEEPVNAHVRTFVSLKQDRKKGKKGYRVLAQVMSEEESREQLLQDAFEDMKVFKKKYRLLTELAAVFEAMDSVK